MAETMEKYQQTFIREMMGENSKGRKVHKAWQLVLKYKEPNPSYVERPAIGNDTRKPSQKRREIWKQVSKVSHARTKTVAIKELESWREEMEDKARAPKRDTSTSVTDYIEQYISIREAAGAIEGSTSRDYRHSAKRLSQAFSHVRMADLTAPMVQQWEISELKKGISATVVCKVHRLLVAVCKWGVKRGDIAVNPVDLVEPPKRPKTTPNSLDQKQMQYLTATLMQLSPTPLVTSAFLALHAGLRAGECCGLTWRDVDFNNQEVHVERAIGVGDGGAYVKTPKSSSSLRTVPIDDELTDMLRRRREQMEREFSEADVVSLGTDFESLYVVGSISGRFLNPTVLSRRWHDMAEDHGLVGTQGRLVVFHDLRHSNVTAAVHAGMDVSNIAANAGHASTQMTLDVYSSSTREGKRRTAQAVGYYMRPASPTGGEVVQLKPTGTEG